ncbi:hypothetical protein [Candidatus Rhabdochlamydia sp. T3358]|uniref:hypothetical protein n=1 Tax=Candidatus Rhabdochlamydia sp. T3358 TaxID=2099795 RepID=UPI0010FE5109|nr:hypothetical protein [Candidatus Rhabdochlamydia sp. T3358]
MLSLIKEKRRFVGQQHQKKPTVRLTIDFPTEQHAYLKMLAAKKGMSMRQYVIESLCENIEKQEHIDLNENKFKEYRVK